MKVLLMRHSEPDYSQVDHNQLVGYGRDISRLTDRGISLAQNASLKKELDAVQIVLSSPYTRALETAGEIIRHRDIHLKVELGLREWQPDMTGKKLESGEQADLALKYFNDANGQLDPKSPLIYETREQMLNRLNQVFQKYVDRYQTILCVTHGVLMRQLVPQEQIDYCEILPYDYF